MLIQNQLFQKFLKLLLRQGKKQKIQKLIIRCFKQFRSLKMIPNKLFLRAVNNVCPTIGILLIKKQQKTVFKPRYLSYEQRIALGIKWLLLGAVRANKKKNFKEALCQEFLKAYAFNGYAFKQKIEIQYLIELNLKTI